jgi:cell division protein FtsZ
LINLDFADVRSVMDEMGKAMMGTGEAEGEDRAIQAADKAIANPLLDEISLRGAKGVLINITGGHDLTLFELDEAANRIREEVDPEANIIVGSTLDTELGGVMRVSVVATGIDATDVHSEVPVTRRSMSAPLPASFAAEEPAVAAPVVVEPSFFEDLNRQEAAAADMAEDVASNAHEVPAPAYQPAVTELESQHEEIQHVEQSAFVAPSAPAPGTPSTEAMARLRAAAERAAPSAAPAPLQNGEADRPRFGINSLINRMTGHTDQRQPEPQVVRHQPPVQQQAAVATQPAEAVDPDQERIEIPAFLRRQAN